MDRVYNFDLTHIVDKRNIGFIECAVNTFASNEVCAICGHCKDSIPCNRTNGQCVNGCDKQWIGNTCKRM